MFGVPVMRFRLKIEVWDSGFGFRFGMQSLGFRFKILVWDSGLRLRFDIQVCNQI